MGAALRRSLDIDPTTGTVVRRRHRGLDTAASSDAGRWARVEHLVAPVAPWLVVGIGAGLCLAAGTRFFGALVLILGGLLLLIERSVRYPTETPHRASVGGLSGYHPSPVAGIAVEVHGRLGTEDGRRVVRDGIRSVPLRGPRRTDDTGEVVVDGWYRDVPEPLLEARHVERADGSGVGSARWKLGYVAAVGIVALGVALAVVTAL